MSRLWDKGSSLDELVLRFTAGEDYRLDARLVPYDIRASISHASMLAACGHLTAQQAKSIQLSLEEIAKDFLEGKWQITLEDEDCHTAIEAQLANRIGEDGMRVHLARSRNDQVLAALRLYYKDSLVSLTNAVRSVAAALEPLTASFGSIPIPGYTHLQRAMPSSVGDWCGAYQAELADDADGLQTALRRCDKNPLGSAAGYGTPGVKLDRDQTTSDLGFQKTHSPVTAVQLSRGKAEAQIAFECCLALQDLGRLASDLCLFATSEFGFVKLPERFTTGSSVMPQKRNPDALELIRGHSAQAPSALQAILSICQKMPSGYHRDLQLIKPALFGLIDLTLECCEVMAHILPNLEFNEEKCHAAMDPSLFAAERAFALVQKEGIPFREAYRRIAQDL